MPRRKRLIQTNLEAQKDPMKSLKTNLLCSINRLTEVLKVTSIRKRIKEERIMWLPKLRICWESPMKTLFKSMIKTWIRCLSWSFHPLNRTILVMKAATLSIEQAKSILKRSRTWEPCRRTCFHFTLSLRELSKDTRNASQPFWKKTKMPSLANSPISSTKALKVSLLTVIYSPQFRNFSKRITSSPSSWTNTRSTSSK